MATPKFSIQDTDATPRVDAGGGEWRRSGTGVGTSTVGLPVNSGEIAGGLALSAQCTERLQSGSRPNAFSSIQICA